MESICPVAPASASNACALLWLRGFPGDSHSTSRAAPSCQRDPCHATDPQRDLQYWSTSKYLSLFCSSVGRLVSKRPSTAVVSAVHSQLVFFLILGGPPGSSPAA